MRIRPTCLILPLLVFLTALPAGAESLKLDGVPDRLSFPLPEGTNQILTARIDARDIRSVWLATSADARGRVMLTRSGDGEYQANLADPLVAAVLGKGSGQFRIYAETAGGRTLESVAVRYTSDATHERIARPRLTIIRGDERRSLDPVPWPREDWQTTADVSAFDIRLDPNDDSWQPRARIGDKSFSFERSDTRGRYNLALTDAMRSAWRENGELRIGSVDDDLWVLKAIPTKLNLKDEPATVVVFQRAAEPIPASNGYLRLEISDITAGQTLVSLRTGSDEAMIDRKSMTQGDETTFSFAGQEYTIKLDRMVNKLIGNDFATFSIERAREKPAARAEQ